MRIARRAIALVLVSRSRCEYVFRVIWMFACPELPTHILEVFAGCDEHRRVEDIALDSLASC